MSQMARAFLGIATPPDFHARLTRLQRELGVELPGCRWTSDPPFHATLAFLGDVAAEQLPLAAEVAAQATAGRPQRTFTLAGLGGFPSLAKARVIWCGITADDPAAFLDHQRTLILELQNAGFDPDARPFHPHVTLGRSGGRGPGANLSPLPRKLLDWRGGTFQAQEIVLYARFHSGSPSLYALAARVPW